MFKFISQNGKENIFEERVVEIEKSISPIKEILNKNDFSSFSILLNEQTISLLDSFQLQVNVKDVGSFRFIFSKDGFDKDDIINKISTLKDINVIDVRSAQNKVNALINIIDQPSLLFMIYDALDDLYIDENYFRYLMNHQIQTFLIKKEQEEEIMYELNVGEQPVDNQNKKKKSSLKINKEGIKKFFRHVAEKKFHFLLLLVSSILFEVSIPLAIVNVYSANAIYIFLFICSIIGIGMDGYSFYDLFKKHGPKHSMSIASYVTNVLGIGVGVGLFALFYNLSNLEEGVPSMGSMIWIGLLISLILSGAIIIVAYFLPKKRKKAKNNTY